MQGCIQEMVCSCLRNGVVQSQLSPTAVLVRFGRKRFGGLALGEEQKLQCSATTARAFYGVEQVGATVGDLIGGSCMMILMEWCPS